MCTSGSAPSYAYTDPGDRGFFGMKDYNELKSQGASDDQIRSFASSAPNGVGPEAARILGLRPYTETHPQAAASLADAKRVEQETLAQIAAQEEEMRALKEQQKQAAAEQTRRMEELRVQEAQQRAQLEQQRKDQEAQIARDRLNSSAVTQSMRVLAGRQQPMNQAPTAPLTSQRPRARVRSGAATQTLRIGESSRATGVGVNIGG